jgi:hypothetical protein
MIENISHAAADGGEYGWLGFIGGDWPGLLALYFSPISRAASSRVGIRECDLKRLGVICFRPDWLGSRSKPN